MIINTFCHVPGIGQRTEGLLWDGGVRTWDDYLEVGAELLTPQRHEFVCAHLYESQERLREQDVAFFADTMPAAEHWRLFREFRGRIAYVDIETTGLSPEFGNHITTAALYDGRQLRHYINGENLRDLQDDLFDYDVLVTYNGKSFDIPFIERYFMITLPQAQIDLRYVLASLGFRGGLKGCERALGIDRGELDGVDGYFAVLLWQDYDRMGNRRALDTLLAYNIEDTVNLERLMVEAYNRKVAGLPFEHSHRMALPTSVPAIPVEPDPETIDRIRMRMAPRY